MEAAGGGWFTLRSTAGDTKHLAGAAAWHWSSARIQRHHWTCRAGKACVHISHNAWGLFTSSFNCLFCIFHCYYCKKSSTEMVCNLGRCIVMPMLAMDRTTISSIYPLFRPTYDHQNENSYERKHCQSNVMTIMIVIIMIWWCHSCMFIILICHFLLCALAGCGAVYCNQSCLWVCVCWSITTITRNCMHRSSPNWVCR